jgi:hypothetical protein
MLGPLRPPAEATRLVADARQALSSIEDDEERSVWTALLLPYLPTNQLWPCAKDLLEMGARQPRSAVLMFLAGAQGLVNEAFPLSPGAGGNRIPGSPLTRLGGPSAVNETLATLRDVSSWWP